MRELLSNRRYRHLFAAQIVALTGTGLATVALGLLAYDLAGSRAAAVLGSALAVKMVAYVVVSPLVGAVADRVPRRVIMVGADLVRAGVVLVLPWVTQVWQVFALIAVLQAASAAFTPVFQSVLPDVVPGERDYARALSLSQVAVGLETVLSPVLAAAALLVTTYSTLFVGTAAGFLASAALVVTTAVPAPDTRAAGSFGTRLALGVRLFRATPRLRGMMALNLVVAATGAISLVTTVNVVRDLLGGGESQVGLLLAAAGAGTVAAAASAPRLGRRLGDRGVMLTGAGVSVCATTAALALLAAPSWAVAVPVWVLVGAGPGWIVVSTGRVVRDSAGPAQRPALFSAQFSLSHACWLLTYPLAGALTVSGGFAVAWAVLALLAVLATVAALVLWPVRGADVVRHRHDTGTDGRHLVAARRAGHGWTHAHRPVVDDHHPHGPVPA